MSTIGMAMSPESWSGSSWTKFRPAYMPIPALGMVDGASHNPHSRRASELDWDVDADAADPEDGEAHVAACAEEEDEQVIVAP
jgi:hypothetical protein